MLKAGRRTSILAFAAIAGSGVALAIPPQNAPATITEDAFNAVDRVLARKDLNDLPDYKDDRSTSESLILSFYNAINRGEFSRAYSYYAEGGRPEFVGWVRGYENTRSTKVITGPGEGDPGAGILYWHQPVAIEAEDYNGEKTVFGGCYEIRMAAPLNQEAPPFSPMTITSGSLKRSAKPLEQSVPTSCMPGINAVGVVRLGQLLRHSVVRGRPVGSVEALFQHGVLVRLLFDEAR